MFDLPKAQRSSGKLRTRGGKGIDTKLFVSGGEKRKSLSFQGTTKIAPLATS